MTPVEYQELANRTCKQFPGGLTLPQFHTDLLHATLGISGEAGELVDSVKKSLIYSKPVDLVNLKEEAGDILWYMALLCRVLGCTFEELMAANIDKLKKRYPEKYTDAAAIARADKQETGETAKSEIGEDGKVVAINHLPSVPGVTPAVPDSPRV